MPNTPSASLQQSFVGLGRVEVDDQHLVADSVQRELAVDFAWTPHERQPPRVPTTTIGSVEDDMNAGAVDRGELAKVQYNQMGS